MTILIICVGSKGCCVEARPSACLLSMEDDFTGVMAWLDEIGTNPSHAESGPPTNHEESHSQSVVEAPAVAPPSASVVDVDVDASPSSGSQQAPPAHVDVTSVTDEPAHVPPVESAPEVPEAESGVSHDRDDIYQLYVPDLQNPMKRVKDSRGKQLRSIRIATACSGLAPESKFDITVKLKHTSEWTCDSKESSWRFIEANGPVEGHHFVDFRELAASIDLSCPGKAKVQGRCARHEFQQCTVELEIGELDSFHAGVSCKPYSVARSDRASGTKSHRDAWCMDAFLSLVSGVRPRTALLENVHGFIMPESKSDPTSPLKRFLAAAAEQCPTYSIQTFRLPGTTFLHFSRRRVFVCMIDNHSGGDLAVDRLKRYVTERCSRQCDRNSVGMMYL